MSKEDQSFEIDTLKQELAITRHILLTFLKCNLMTGSYLYRLLRLTDDLKRIRTEREDLKHILEAAERHKLDETRLR